MVVLLLAESGVVSGLFFMLALPGSVAWEGSRALIAAIEVGPRRHSGVRISEPIPRAAMDKSIGFVIGINGTYLAMSGGRVHRISPREIGSPISAAMLAEFVILAGARRQQLLRLGRN